MSMRAEETGLLERTGVPPPGRKCLGIDGWCGEPATHVAREEDGMERFCCPAHHGSPADLTPIDVWFEAVRLLILAKEAEDLLRSF